MLKSGRRPRRSWLGLAIQPVDARLAASFGLEGIFGARVCRVLMGSPAARAGLRPGMGLPTAQ